MTHHRFGASRLSSLFDEESGSSPKRLATSGLGGVYPPGLTIGLDAYYRRSEGEEVRPDDPSNDLSELHVAKHRNGPVGTINLRFQSRYTRFVDDYAAARA